MVKPSPVGGLSLLGHRESGDCTHLPFQCFAMLRLCSEPRETEKHDGVHPCGTRGDRKSITPAEHVQKLESLISLTNSVLLLGMIYPHPTSHYSHLDLDGSPPTLTPKPQHHVTISHQVL